MYFNEVDRNKVKPSEKWLLDFWDEVKSKRFFNGKEVLEYDLIADIVAELINYKFELDKKDKKVD